MLWELGALNAPENENKYLRVMSKDKHNYFLIPTEESARWLKRVRARVKIVQKWKHRVSGMEMRQHEMQQIIYEETPIRTNEDGESESESSADACNAKYEIYIYPLRPLRVSSYLAPYLYLMYSFLQITRVVGDFWETIQTTNQSDNPLDYLIAGLCDTDHKLFRDIETLFSREPTLDILVRRFAELLNVQYELEEVNFANADSKTSWNDENVHAVIIKMRSDYQLFLKYTLEDGSHLYFTASGANVSTFDPEKYSVKELITGREGILIRFKGRSQLVRNSWKRIDTIHRRGNPNRPVDVYELDNDGIPNKKRTCSLRSLLLAVNSFFVSYHPKYCPFPAAEVWGEEDTSFLSIGTSESRDYIRKLTDKPEPSLKNWYPRQLVWIQATIPEEESEDKTVDYKPIVIHRSPEWTLGVLRKSLLENAFPREAKPAGTESQEEQRIANALANPEDWEFYKSEDLVTMKPLFDHKLSQDELFEEQLNDLDPYGLILRHKSSIGNCK